MFQEAERELAGLEGGIMKSDNLWQCCGNCYYFIVNKMTHYHSDKLECHKNAPVAVDKKAEWPVVAIPAWCDEWSWDGKNLKEPA